MPERRPRVVILGGGFAGAYTARRLEKLTGHPARFDVALVNRNNYFVFQPLLSEVVSGAVDLVDTVVALRRMLQKTDVFVREIQEVDLKNRRVILRGDMFPRPYTLEYDHLIFALGTGTDFRSMPGLPEHALGFKDLSDAITLRNHIIHVLEEADTQSDPEIVRQLLTFVVAGGGFSGVEVVSVMNDFIRRIVRNYRDIDPSLIRVILLHSGDRVLDREFGEKLSHYAERIMKKGGVELVLHRRLKAATPDHAILDNGERIPTKTLVSTVPATPSPVIEHLDLPMSKDRINVDLTLQVEGSDHLWALGDCARIPSPTGDGFTPPTAQHAVREAKVLAHNVAAAFRGGEKKQFAFTGLGKLGLVGHHRGVAELFNRIRLSGPLAWFMWRSVYWWKLPGLDRKAGVGASWALDVIFPPDMVELDMRKRSMVERAHFEPGEVVFEKGDTAACVYIVLDGRAEVLVDRDGHDEHIGDIGPGEFFGVSALVEGGIRPETVRCVEPMDVICVQQHDLTALMAELPELRQSLEETMRRRTDHMKPAPAQAPPTVPLADDRKG